MQYDPLALHDTYVVHHPGQPPATISILFVIDRAKRPAATIRLPPLSHEMPVPSTAGSQTCYARPSGVSLQYPKKLHIPSQVLGG